MAELINTGSVGDIEIGAVEIKDGSTDTRGTVNAANTARTATTNVLVTQPIDAAGNVLGKDAANTARTTATLVAPVQPIDASGNVMGRTAANTARTTSTLVDPAQVVGADGTVMPTGSLVSNAPFSKITDGSTPVGVVGGGVNSLKSDLSSVNGSTAAVGSGVATGGAQRVTLARDARGNSLDPEYKSPQDFTVAFTSSTTITCSGAPITIDDTNGTVQYVQIKPTAGTSWGARYINGQDGVSLIAASNVITIYGAGTPFVTGDTYRVGFCSQRKGYTAASTSNRSEEVNPLSQQVVEESLVDTTNVAASAQYYPSSLGMAMLGYKNFSITGKYIDGDATTTTLSVQGTNDEDATNADWLDIQGQINGLASTTAAIPTVTGTVAGVTGVAVVPGTVCNLITTAAAQTVKFTWDFDNCNYRYLRVVATPGDATNTLILKVRRSAL